jgi:DNA-binding transcriptional regulator YdaS (Cro superfamily)
MHTIIGIERAVEIFGTQQKLAEKLGVSAAAVSTWVSGTARLPIMRAIQIEKATGGAVCAEDLRPDIFGATDPADDVFHG